MKSLKLKFLIVLFVGIVLGFGLNWAVFELVERIKQLKEDEENAEVSHQSGYQFINPLLDFSVDYKEIPELRDKINKYLETEKKNGRLKVASIYFRKMNSGKRFIINENERFSPASLLKVPLMIACLKQAEVDPVFLQRQIVYRRPQEEHIIQNITNEDPLINGQTYTVDQLIARLIVNSDNEAAEILHANVDPVILDKVYSDLNLLNPKLPGLENFMTVKDYSTFIRILYNSTYLNRDMSEYALFVLTHARFKGGIVRGVPQNIHVAHKFGEREIDGVKQLHDCGIIYYEQGPCLLCIMTRGRDFEELKNIIGGVSRIVSDEVIQGKEFK